VSIETPSRLRCFPTFAELPHLRKTNSASGSLRPTLSGHPQNRGYDLFWLETCRLPRDAHFPCRRMDEHYASGKKSGRRWRRDEAGVIKDFKNIRTRKVLSCAVSIPLATLYDFLIILHASRLEPATVRDNLMDIEAIRQERLGIIGELSL
jgi:hypothetical protein